MGFLKFSCDLKVPGNLQKKPFPVVASGEHTSGQSSNLEYYRFRACNCFYKFNRLVQKLLLAHLIANEA